MLLFCACANGQGSEQGASESGPARLPESIGDNENTAEIETGTETEIPEDEAKTYDTITLGSWRNEPIEWRVLETRDENTLVISSKILALRQYHDDALSLPDWADCSLRSWLNNDFYQAAFSEKEQQAISSTLVKTPDFETEFETLYTSGSVEKTPVLIKGSEDTEDMVFCLSVEEANNYFDSAEDRIAYRIVVQQDYDYFVQVLETIDMSPEESLYYFGRYELNEETPDVWWLRSGTYVGFSGDVWVGSITMDGDIPQGWPCGVRPAMWLQSGDVGVEIKTNE